MKASKPVEIIGGGLAGLSLGIGLLRAGVPVTIFEAGHYPRHRVCGEFIAGLDDSTLAALGIPDLLDDALQHRHISWLRHGRLMQRQTLPKPARALSRMNLDARLARVFRAAGGTLVCGVRADSAPREGRVHACGRQRLRHRSPWLGLKMHVRGVALQGDLEVHLGNRAYVGLCAVETGAINVCGLFRRREGVALSRESALFEYMRLAGLTALASRIKEGTPDKDSFCAVAGFGFKRPAGRRDLLCLGDAFTMIPPFTGNGMAIAFQSAETTLPHVLSWARGEVAWPEAVKRGRRAQEKRFTRRLALAAALHPFLVARGPQTLFQVANRTGLLPMRRLARAIHA